MDLKDFGKIECPKCNTRFRPLGLFKKKQIKETVKKNRELGLTNSNKRLVNENEICAICAEPLDLKWTVEHGQAYCTTCGAPYYLYKRNAMGKDVKGLYCGIKESVRAGFRSIWHQYGNDLAKYSEGKRVQYSSNAKVDMRTSKTIEKEAGIDAVSVPEKMDPRLMLKAVEALEGRDLENSEEKIEILADKGWLVHQKFKKGSLDSCMFYSEDRIRNMVSILKAKNS